MAVFMLKGLEGNTVRVASSWGQESSYKPHGGSPSMGAAEQALLRARALAKPHNLANLICKAQTQQAGNRKEPWSSADHAETVSELKGTYLTGRKMVPWSPWQEK